jgi:multiple sugar transport system substrate-binding protein
VTSIVGYSLRFAGAIDPATYGSSESARELLIRRQLVESRYNVRIRTVDVPAAQLVPRLTSSVLAGDPFADVIQIDVNSVVPGLADQNLILPLDAYFDFTHDAWSAMPADLARYRGATYGFLEQPEATRGLWYNRTLLRRLGQPDPDQLVRSGAWTWGAFLTACRAVIAVQADEPLFALAVAEDPTNAVIFSNGGSIVGRRDGRFTVALDSPAAIEALQLLGTLWQEGLILQGDAVGSFLAGRSAFLAGPIELGPVLAEQMPEEYAWTYFPRGPRVTRHTVVATSLPVSVFPTGLRYPPDRLAKICTELAAPDLQAAIRRDRLALLVPDPRSLEVAVQMGNRVEVDRSNAFPGLSRVMTQIMESVKAGVAPSQAVTEHRDAALRAVPSQ